MPDVILLSTNWSNSYWRQNGCAPFTNFNFRQMGNWQVLNECCPIPGIGYYRDHNSGRCSFGSNFEFIRINGMRNDQHGFPYFDFEFIQSSNSPSSAFYRKLNVGVERNFFTSITEDRCTNILNSLNEGIPDNWLARNENNNAITQHTPRLPQPGHDNWKNLVGSYYLDLLGTQLSNAEFENRIFQILISLGFIVTQQGHTLVGTYPDGKATLDEYILVYDCKNSNDFFPIADDQRAMTQYLANEQGLNPNSKVIPVFIAKSFSPNITNNQFSYWTSESLLYLIYKMLISGYKFNLRHIKGFLDNRIQLTKENIDARFLC